MAEGITNSKELHIGSENEKICGCWYDGRPIYSKTVKATVNSYEASTPQNFRSFKIPFSASNFFAVISAEGWYENKAGTYYLNVPLPLTIPTYTASSESVKGFLGNSLTQTLYLLTPSSWAITEVYVEIEVKYLKTVSP